MNDDKSVSRGNPTEAEMRRGFIELDVRARTVGGVQNLFRDHQILYVRFGRATGFLSVDEARELVQELGLRSYEVGDLS